eukprot:TRINITY_DN108819_c0_g1_i1.p1 TRINITY_DN108819_c0_g1~~TRINITY_DN108819_c0_g1_i1.p1  ORF type:complete len:424 (-),score=88.61 TRINITY_DN108819_c0_g1_i1:139-1383(-)
MADGKFRPPKWCRSPRSPERHRKQVCFVGDKAHPVALELLDKALYTIGRGDTSDIQLKGDLASRLHAAVLQDADGQRFLVDLKSTHGTFLSSKRLKAHDPVPWPEGTSAHFGSGTKAEVLLLGKPSADEKVEESDAKRRKVGDAKDEVEAVEPKPSAPAIDPLASLYGDLPEATVTAVTPKPEVKFEPLAPPIEDPTKVVFLDIDGVLRPLHSRQDAFQNTRTIDIGGAKVALLGNSEAKAGVDFWPGAMRALRFIVQKTDARIVLSSDWRKEEVLKDGIKSAFEEYSMPELYSQTPDLDQASVGVIKALHSSFREKRCKEIRKWLRQHPKVTNYCAIDDIDLSMPDKEALRAGRDPSKASIFLDSSFEFVKTNPTVGLNMDLARLIVCYVNGTEPTADVLEKAFSSGAGLQPQ